MTALQRVDGASLQGCLRRRGCARPSGRQTGVLCEIFGAKFGLRIAWPPLRKPGASKSLAKFADSPFGGPDSQPSLQGGCTLRTDFDFSPYYRAKRSLAHSVDQMTRIVSLNDHRELLKDQVRDLLANAIDLDARAAALEQGM